AAARANGRWGGVARTHHAEKLMVASGGGGGFRAAIPTPHMGPNNPPQQSTKLAPISLQSRAPPLGVNVVLIPKPVLLLRRRRFNRAGDVLDVVTVGGDQAEYALGPQRGDDAGGAPAPVIAGEHGAVECERVDELLEVVA